MSNLGRIINTQIYLFGQYGIPGHFKEAERFERLRGIPGLKQLFHEARSGIYCGTEKPNFHSDKSIRLALDNFEIGLEILVGAELGALNGSTLRFQLKPKEELMPEALWYCPITHQNQQAARIGINFHYQNGTIVATIANIQCRNKAVLDALKCRLGSETRYWAVEAVTSIIENLPNDISVIRGISSAAHPSRNNERFDRHSTSCLYDRTFRHPKIGMEPIRNNTGSVAFYELFR